MSAMHLRPRPSVGKPKLSPSSSKHGKKEDKEDLQEAKWRCTQCGDGHKLDNQSGHTVARSKFLTIFQGSSPAYPLVWKTCVRQSESSGSLVYEFVDESIGMRVSLPPSMLLECNQITNNSSVIPTPNSAHLQTHLKHLADIMYPLDPNADIVYFLGSGVIRIHKVQEQIRCSDNDPFTQKLDLGWIIDGGLCLGGALRSLEVSSYTSMATPIIYSHVTDRSKWRRPSPKHRHLQFLLSRGTQKQRFRRRHLHVNDCWSWTCSFVGQPKVSSCHDFWVLSRQIKQVGCTLTFPVTRINAKRVHQKSCRGCLFSQRYRLRWKRWDAELHGNAQHGKTEGKTILGFFSETLNVG